MAAWQDASSRNVSMSESSAESPAGGMPRAAVLRSDYLLELKTKVDHLHHQPRVMEVTRFFWAVESGPRWTMPRQSRRAELVEQVQEAACTHCIRDGLSDVPARF